MTKKIRKILIYLCFVLALTGCSDGPCYDKHDLGEADFEVIIPSKPKKEGENMLRLMKEKPKSSQVVEWTHSGYNVIGGKTPLIIKITGEWYPWGGGTLDNTEKSEEEIDENRFMRCTAESSCDRCTFSPFQSLLCKKCEQVDVKNKKRTEIISDLKVPSCALRGGLGVYGAITYGKGNRDINTSWQSSADPHRANNNTVQTFHIYDYNPISSKQEVVIDKALKCNKENNGKYKCQATPLEAGSLFFKIMDGHYEDNYGNVKIKIVSGVYNKGIVAEIIEKVQEGLKEASNTLMNSFLNNSYFKNITRTIILLYISILGIMFMLGTIKMHQSELVIRIFKLSIVNIILGEANDIISFLDTYLISLFHNIGEYFSNMITSSVFKLVETSKLQDVQTIINSIKNTEADQAGVSNMSYFIIYDNLLKQLTSTALNYKILSLIFTPKTYFVFLLYILVIILIMVVIRAVSLYLFAFLQINILIALAPIFLTLILFKTTQDYFFSRWLKFMGSSAMLIVIVTAVGGLMYYSIESEMAKLFAYRICAIPFPLPFPLLTMYFPTNNDYEVALNIDSYFYVLFFSLVFHLLITEAPRISDAISSPAIRGTQTSVDRAVQSSMSDLGSLINKTGEYLGRGREYTAKQGRKMIGLKSSDYKAVFDEKANQYVVKRNTWFSKFAFGEDIERKKIHSKRKEKLVKSYPILAPLLSTTRNTAANMARSTISGLFTVVKTVTPGTKTNLELLKSLDRMMIDEGRLEWLKQNEQARLSKIKKKKEALANKRETKEQQVRAYQKLQREQDTTKKQLDAALKKQEANKYKATDKKEREKLQKVKEESKNEIQKYLDWKKQTKKKLNDVIATFDDVGEAERIIAKNQDNIAQDLDKIAELKIEEQKLEEKTKKEPNTKEQSQLEKLQKNKIEQEIKDTEKMLQDKREAMYEELYKIEKDVNEIDQIDNIVRKLNTKLENIEKKITKHHKLGKASKHSITSKLDSIVKEEEALTKKKSNQVIENMTGLKNTLNYNKNIIDDIEEKETIKRDTKKKK